MENYELAFKDYQEGMKYKEIAEKYDVSINTVKSWKSRKWGATTDKKVAHKNEKVATKRTRKGKGGSPPKNNKNAVTHGLFAKWLPEETQEIMNEVAQSDPADIIWSNIMIQYTAIIRSQQIMYVRDIEDMSRELSGNTEFGETYDVQYAWDKQANFLSAQSRAMGTLSKLIKQFVSIADERDERRKRLELMNAQVTKVRSEADIVANRATKLNNKSKSNEALQALLDVMGDKS